MQNLRRTLLEDYCIPMTPEESQKNTNRWLVTDPTWLAEHRDEPSTHPYFKGPFTEKNVRWYHIYCSWEKWKELQPHRSGHWDNHDDAFGYHAIYSDFIDMILPIKQRCFSCVYGFEAEIFDNQHPYYSNLL